SLGMGSVGPPVETSAVSFFFYVVAADFIVRLRRDRAETLMLRSRQGTEIGSRRRCVVAFLALRIALGRQLLGETAVGVAHPQLSAVHRRCESYACVIVV